MNEILPPKTPASQSAQAVPPLAKPQSADIPEKNPAPKSNLNTLWIALIMFVLGVIGGVLLALTYPKIINKPQTQMPQISNSPTQTVPNPSTLPTPTLAPIIDATDSASTANWKTYINNEYTFKYPKGLKPEIGAGGEGTDSIRISFMGQKQIATGKTETDLLDGYSFLVAKISSNNNMTADQRLQSNSEYYKNNGCGSAGKMSPAISKQIAGANAYQYSVDCLGNSTISIVTHEGNVYEITQNYVGFEDNEKEEEYHATTDQILSTFKFTQ